MSTTAEDRFVRGIGRRAVAEAYCRILAARNPGTHWVPWDETQGTGTTPDHAVVVRLAGPRDDDSPEAA